MENPTAPEIPHLDDPIGPDPEFWAGLDSIRLGPDPDVAFLIEWEAMVLGTMRGIRFALAEAAEEAAEAVAEYQGRVSPCGLHVVSWGALACPHCARLSALAPLDSVRRW